jgi:hypothetical protein
VSIKLKGNENEDRNFVLLLILGFIFVFQVIDIVVVDNLEELKKNSQPINNQYLD